MFLWSMDQDWCETIPGTDVGDFSGSMERFLQNLGVPSVHIDVWSALLCSPRCLHDHNLKSTSCLSLVVALDFSFIFQTHFLLHQKGRPVFFATAASLCVPPALGSAFGDLTNSQKDFSWLPLDSSSPRKLLLTACGGVAKSARCFVHRGLRVVLPSVRWNYEFFTPKAPLPFAFHTLRKTI